MSTGCGGTKQGLIIGVDREKQDQSGKGRFIGIVRGRHLHTDPVRVLRAWLRARGGNVGPLFPRLDPTHTGERMNGECIYRIVKECLGRVGIDATGYGPHSLRSGCISAAGEANVGVLQIGAYTGQSAAMVERYFRRTDIWKNNVSGKLGL